MPETPLSDAAVDRRIRAHRTAEVTLSVADAAGRPIADAPVTIEMVRHRFLFGCNAFGLGGDIFAPGEFDTEDRLRALYAERYAALLNYATLPFYWGSYERERGTTNEPRVRRMAEWCRAHGIATKGHPLCWHEGEPAWIQQLPLDELETVQMSRIRRDVGGFAGTVDRWDIVNEAVVMPDKKEKEGWPATSRLCRKIGRVPLLKRCFDAASEANPGATLLLNDFITDDRFADLIDECLAAGMRIDVIGLQSHMHKGYLGAEWAWEACERFARFNRPIHFTELTILSGALKAKDDNEWHRVLSDWDSTPDGEERQREQVVELYRLLYSHPAVEAITWWDFADTWAWQGAPAGFLRKDLSPKPAYDALMGLVKRDWWTGPLAVRTDAAGRARFRGFLGDYTAKTDRGQGAFAVERSGDAEASVRIE